MNILVMATNGFGPRYFAMMVMIGANYSGYVVALGWISNGNYVLFTCENACIYS